MSAYLTGRVWFLKLSRVEQLVLLALADHAHDDGSSVFPSVGYTAWKTGLNERTVQRAIRSLQAKRLLVLVAEAGRRRPREYRIDLGHATTKPPYRREEGEPLAHNRGRNPSEGRQSDAPDRGGVASGTTWGGTEVVLGAASGPPEPSVEPSREPSDSSSAREPTTEEELPEDFPDDLRPALEAVWPVIERVGELKGTGGSPPSRLSVARAIASFPDRDHVDAATDLEQWLLYGTGRNLVVADVVQSYRRTLARIRRREPAATAPDAARPDFSRFDRAVRR